MEPGGEGTEPEQTEPVMTSVPFTQRLMMSKSYTKAISGSNHWNHGDAMRPSHLNPWHAY
jgi:hypothetical protein